MPAGLLQSRSPITPEDAEVAANTRGGDRPLAREVSHWFRELTRIGNAPSIPAEGV
jgi:hypothetical protein